MNHLYKIAVCHQKGGVGKTTTVTGLGASLAENGSRTLLIDLDPAANLTSGLGIHHGDVPKSISRVLLDRDRLASVARATGVEGLDILPSRPEPTGNPQSANLRAQQEHLLLNYFALNRDALANYHFVVMDCPPSLGPLAMAALYAADLALIPVQCEYYSLQALEAVFLAIKYVRADINPALRYRLLVTMFDRRGSLHTRLLQRLQQQMAGGLMETMIGFDSKVRESQIYGIPVNLHAPATRAAQQYRSLASEIYSYAEAQIVHQPS